MTMLTDVPINRTVAASNATYADLLQAEGFSSETSYPWLKVIGSVMEQGWKLHISSTPAQVPLLLRVLLPVLRENKISFKIASSSATLFSLNEGGFGATQVGKFATLYPKSTEEAVKLARELLAKLDGFMGPAVPTDLHIGGIVFARYGGIEPRMTRDLLGQMQRWISMPDGLSIEDRYTVPFEMPHGLANPFAEMMNGQQRASTAIPYKLGPGYLVVKRIREHPKGDVLLVIDMRRQESVDCKVIKQGRRGCLADENGRDMRVRLRRQFQIHRALAGRVTIPQAELLFEDKDDLFLVLERIQGDTLESFTLQALDGEGWGELSAEAKQTLLRTLAAMAMQVAQLHAAGFVHRDLTPTNVLVSANGEVRIIDMELAHAVDECVAPFALGTNGFMSPNQRKGGRPEYADDSFALGCLLLFSTTGIDPRRLPFADTLHRGSAFPEQLFSGVPQRLQNLIQGLVAEDAMARPSAVETSNVLQLCVHEAVAGSPHKVIKAKRRSGLGLNRLELRQSAEAAVRGLLEHVCMRPDTGLWLSTPISGDKSQSGAFVPELRRSINRGVAGSVYALSRASQAGILNDTDELKRRVVAGAEWLIAKERTEDLGMPGLHFGEAGVALALSEAVKAGLLDASPAVFNCIGSAFHRTPWFDITHGAAGIGMSALSCAQTWNQPEWGAAATAAAEMLIEAQDEEGFWRAPEGVSGMSGEVLTGFAHGVAGIVYFLAVYSCERNDPAARRASERGAQWLLRSAQTASNGSLNWEYSDTHGAVWKWWCHGAPGIALMFLRLHALWDVPEYADAARAALRCHSPALRYPNLSQCHGLSGLAEIYLEAGDLLGDPEWNERAGSIISVILGLGRQHEGGALTWLVENAQAPVADFMVGCSGVLHLLLRAQAQTSGERLGFPLLPLGKLSSVRMAH
jgi:serine/threonine protein kinase